MNHNQPALLSAPTIAGLLPAYAESLAKQGHIDPVESTIIYHNPRLAEVACPERERLTQAMQMLMDTVVAFVLGEMNEPGLRAAETLFHKAAGGTPTPVRNPQTYRAERDAELIDWCYDTARRLALVRDMTVS